MVKKKSCSIDIMCDALKCMEKAGYIIIWSGHGKPAIFSASEHHDAVCKKHHDIIMKEHPKLIQAVFDFADEKILLT